MKFTARQDEAAHLAVRRVHYSAAHALAGTAPCLGKKGFAQRIKGARVEFLATTTIYRAWPL